MFGLERKDRRETEQKGLFTKLNVNRAHLHTLARVRERVRPDGYSQFSAAKLPSKKELITSKITVFKM